MSDELDQAITEIRKVFGEGAIVRLDESRVVDVDVLPTGSLGLDLALGVGGIPRGRVTEIYGPEASGKTTLCQHIAASAQALGEDVVYIDMEHALDVEYAKKCGVDIKHLYLVQPDTGEQALEITERLVRTGKVALIIIDSVAALVPRAELEGDMGDAVMGAQARLMSKALRKMSGVLRKSNTALVFTNQLRQKIGIVYGNPEVTSGGVALKYYSSVRIDMRRVEGIKVGKELIGNRVRARVVKNKVAPPFKVAEFDIMYAEGISKEADILETALEQDIVERRGAYYYYGDTQLGQGKEVTRNRLREDTELLERIEEDVRSALRTVPQEEGANEGTLDENGADT